VHLMGCLGCGSGFHGDAGNGYRRIRRSARPACRGQATYRAESYEAQLARSFDDQKFEEADIEQVLAQCGSARCRLPAPNPESLAKTRADL